MSSFVDLFVFNVLTVNLSFFLKTGLSLDHNNHFSVQAPYQGSFQNLTCSSTTSYKCFLTFFVVVFQVQRDISLLKHDAWSVCWGYITLSVFTSILKTLTHLKLVININTRYFQQTFQTDMSQASNQLKNKRSKHV